MELIEFMGYHFVQKALITGIFLALGCSLLGVLLVLRRLSLIGDGLAHVTFGSIAVGLFLQVQPLYAAIPIVIASSLGIWRLTEKARLLGDAAIGVVSSLGIATGVILASVSGGFNVDLFSYLFGNILAISPAEVIMSMLLTLSIIAYFILYYRQIITVTFDEEFAKTTGINTRRINTILVIFTALTVVLAMRVVGIMLTSALLILPAATSLQFARGFISTLFISAIVSMLAVILGIIASFFLDLPAGASIVMVNFLFFITAYAGKRLR
ncbi:MAG: metal ABC transporter permease [Smithellaceae bacterium]|nr:metal ABC transporter permease [Smithellaceae bacterium]